MKKTFRNVIIFALALCFVSAALSLCACKKTPQTIETDYCAYSEIPADYTPEQAEADGCLVVYQSQGTIKNSTVMTDFAKTTKRAALHFCALQLTMKKLSPAVSRSLSLSILNTRTAFIARITNR